jgi:hypothetical protein
VTVIDQAIPPAVSQATQEVLDTAREALEGALEWAGEVAESAREKVSPPPKKRSKLPLLLLAIGLGALAFYLIRRRAGGGEADIAPDAFGAAVEAEGANRNGERAPAVTPGG